MRRGCCRERGAVIPIVALTLGVLIASSALAIDLGRQMLLRRDLQKVADAIALDMARHLDGRPAGAVESDPSWASDLLASQTRNGFVNGTGSKTVQANAGCYDQTSKIWSTFCPLGQNPPLSTIDVATAVRVLLGDRIGYYFYPGTGTSSRAGIASVEGVADFEVGSFLAGFNPSDGDVRILNWVLGRAFRNSNPLAVTAAGYQGLANGNVTARGIAAAYGLADPNQLFTGTVNAGRFFNATADAVRSSGGSTIQISTLQGIAATLDPSAQFSFSGVVDPGGSAAGRSGQGSVFDMSLGLLELVEGTAFVMNGTNTISVPALDVGVPPLASVDLTLKVIEKPRFAFGKRVGESLQTSQVELGLTSYFDVDATPYVALPGARLSGSITLKPSAAGASAYPTAIRCATGIAQSVTMGLDAIPLSATASESLTLAANIGLLGAKVDVLYVNVNNATVSTTSSAGTADFAYTSEFMPAVGTGTMKRIGGSTMNLAGALQATSTNTTVLLLPLPQSTLLAGVNNTLNAALLPAIQNNLLPKVTKLLGLQLGGGDVGTLDMHCNALKLIG